MVDWNKRLQDEGVIWRHSGDSSQPHALLTSGKHSNGYANCARLAERPGLTEEVCAAMIEKIQPYLGKQMPEHIVGPAYGAITIAHEVARQLGVKLAFTEVVYTDEGKMQELKRFEIPTDAPTLVVEDIVTTGGSAQKTIDAVEAAGVTVLPFIGIILNWSGSPKIGEREIVALTEATMNVWEPDECELCRAGSKALRPKPHWNALTKK